jgi:hypothetical protein
MGSREAIAEGLDGTERPFENLIPIVRALVAGGNRCLCGDAGPFYMDRDGWRCDLALPLDFALIEGSFVLPPSIELSRTHGTVLDTNTWVVIEGDIVRRSGDGPMLRVGYWYDASSGEGGVDPRRLSGPTVSDPDELGRLVDYLRTGHASQAWRGYSFCRFECGVPRQEMGSTDRSDGTWTWPEGLAHYVAEHSVGLPPAFLAHVRARGFRHPPAERVAEHCLDARGFDSELWNDWARARGAWQDAP